MVYDEAAVVLAYVESLQPSRPNFERFRKERLSALERAYALRVSYETVASDRAAIAMLFFSSARLLASLRGPRDGMLEDSLVNRQLQTLDPEEHLLDLERAAGTSLMACRAAYTTYLVALFKLLWGPIAAPLESKALRAKTGFDDFYAPVVADDE